MTRSIPKTEVFTLIDSITYTWHNEYVIDAEGPLSVDQVMLTEQVLALVDSAICYFEADDACLSEDSRIGFELQGDRDEYQEFHAFYVSDNRAICCECAHLKDVALTQ
jgi:hypothetical protein